MGSSEDKLQTIQITSRVALRFLQAGKSIKVKNRDTGKVMWKTPKEISENSGRYEKLPQPYHRNPHGRPHKPKNLGIETLPAPPRLPKLPKPKRLPKPKKLPIPVPMLPILEPPKPPQKDTIPGQKWRRD
jgi:hypothetical protein